MELSCGPFRLLYQNGFIRYVRYGETEILRMIYFAVRDENWGTIPLEITDEKLQRTENGFSVRCEAVNAREGKSLVRWQVAIDGNADGSITYAIEGEVLEDFRKNRAGFCVLHSLRETIDQPVILSHGDDNRSEGVFPRYIAPNDPFTEIHEMKWRIDGNWYHLRFEGDIFETEDQRNWSDASFKTFCTPLRMPFPAQLKKDELISQRIVFSSEGKLAAKRSEDPVRISRTDTLLKLPAIGVGSSPSEEFTEKIFSVLKHLRLGHYRLDVDLTNPEWPDIITNDLMIGQRLGLPLEVALQLPQDPRDELDKLINLLRQEKPPIRKVTVLSKGELTTRQHHVSFIPLLKELLPGAQLGVGTDFNFTELNRHRVDNEAADYVTFALDPQEHAMDDLTVIENIEAQYYGGITARELYDIPVHVSPVLLKRKYNPYATDPAAFVVAEEARLDERQQTGFCARWTLGSIKALSNARVEAITYFQAVGPHGIVSAEGVPYPVYEAFEMLLSQKFDYFFETTSSAPLTVDALCHEDGHVLIWNYTDEDQAVRVESLNREVTMPPYAMRIIN